MCSIVGVAASVTHAGTQRTPITPPVSAIAFNASSVLPRAWWNTARAVVWFAVTGPFEIRHASSVVDRPEGLASTGTPRAVRGVVRGPRPVRDPARVQRRRRAAVADIDDHAELVQALDDRDAKVGQ